MIIIPSPYVTNNHQEKNAKYLFNNNCCELIYENKLNVFELSKKIDRLTHNKDLYKNMQNELCKIKYNFTFDDIRKVLFK